MKEKEALIAGVDEAGRGPLAGPVIAAAVILRPNTSFEGLNDSKALSQRKRESLFGEIKDRALAWSIGRADSNEVDEINILQATLLAMQRAVQSLSTRPDKVLIDGKHCPVLEMASEAIVQGDKKIASISAASVLAKVTRDAEMIELDEQYPGYGFALHKGYPTKQHLAALQKKGITPVHRQSYAPVKKLLATEVVEES